MTMNILKTIGTTATLSLALGTPLAASAAEQCSTARVHDGKF